MPDPLTAGLMVSLLARGFTEALGKNLGADADSTLKRFASLVRSRFAGDPQVETALSTLATAPDDEQAKVTLETAIAQRLDADPEFRQALLSFVRDGTATDPAFAHTVVQVGGQATVGKIVQIEQITGDVSF
jgi:hypothetical protein